MSDEREYYWITNPETGTTSRWLASSPEEAVILAGYRPARRPASEETPEAAHARGVAEERARCLAIVVGLDVRPEERSAIADKIRSARGEIAERIVDGGRATVAKRG